MGAAGDHGVYHFLKIKNTSLDFLLGSYFFILSNFAICFHGVGGDRGALE